jgi:outer membrane protein assembly factor BamB
VPVSTVTIDLDVIDDGWDHVDDDAVGLPRGWGLTAVLALLLSLVSAAPPPGRPHEVTRQPLRNGEFHVAGGALYVLDSDRTPTPVEVFDAADGALRWTFTPEGLATFSSVVVRGDLAVLSPDLCRSGVTGTTVAVTRATGRERWRAVGVPVRTPPGGTGTVVMRSLWSDGCRALADNTPTTGVLRWQFIDAAGLVGWDTPVEAGTRVAVDAAAAGATWAALLDAAGGLSTVDLTTGARTVPVTGIAGPADDVFAAVGDLLLVARWDVANGSTWLTAYTRDLVQRWKAQVPTGPNGPLTVLPCDAALCVSGERTAAVDPDSGALLWIVPKTPTAVAPGGALTLPADTGLTVPPGWRFLAAESPRVLLGLRTDHDTLLAWSDGGPAPTPSVSVPGSLVACEIEGALVACGTETDEVVLLRLP